MRDLAILLTLALELAVITCGRRRFGWAPAPTLFGLYLLAAQIMAWLVLHDFTSNDMLEIYGGPNRDSDLFRVIFAAAALFGVVYGLAAAGGAGRPLPHMPWWTGLPKPPLSLAFTGAALWSTLFLAAAVTMDWRRLWSTAHYLDLTDPAVMTHGALSGMALNALPVAGAASAALAAALYTARQPQRALAGLLMLQAIGTTAWLLAAHSRAAALPPAAFVFITMVTSSLRSGAGRIVTGGAFMVLALAGALSGRNLGDHGLASLGALPGLLVNISAWAPDLAANITEGIFAVAAGLGEWRGAAEDSVSFLTSYVWLSFSPLPSAIDGFAQVLDTQVRLHVFAPMPGYIELGWFGPWSQCAFLGLVALAFRLAARTTRLAPLYGASANLLLAGCLYLMAAYPVRTALKLLWLSLAISGSVLAMATLQQTGRHALSPMQRELRR